MEREGFDIPLLIGGATTSRVHTAVKIHPNYARGQAVHVNDASRAVGVVSALLSPETRAATIQSVRAEYRKVAEAHERSEAEKRPRAARKGARQCAESSTGAPIAPRGRASSARAFSNGPILPSWPATSTGRRSSRPGSSRAAIPRSSTMRNKARRRAACSTTRKRCSSASSTSTGSRRGPSSASGPRLRPATTSSSSLTSSRATPTRDLLHAAPAACPPRRRRPNLALADFVAPASSGARDYVGGFVVTAGIGEDTIAQRFEHANDDYSSIMVKALADRFAEALAEAMHARVRREFWGYAPDEAFTPDELIAEPYQRHPPGARLSRPARPH